MEMERCEFPDALRLVAEKCGISIPKPRPSSPAEHTQSNVRSTLVEMHREAQTFFVKQLQGTAEGKLARAYLEDRGWTRRPSSVSASATRRAAATCCYGTSKGNTRKNCCGLRACFPRRWRALV